MSMAMLTSTRAYAMYAPAVMALQRAGVEFLVGGAYALARYTGIVRDTKDFDIFIRPADQCRALNGLAAAGYDTELRYPHWLAKAFGEDHIVDIIFGSGNGVAVVDDGWFEHAVADRFLDLPVALTPVEETIWSKAFIMERERFDGADIAHLIHAKGASLDWARLVARFGQHWRVLLSHLVLFGFIYPGERDAVPGWVMDDLQQRLAAECDSGPGEERVCQGTLLSREQYLPDVDGRGYDDARLAPRGQLSADEVGLWTAAIEGPPPTIEEDCADRGDR